MQKINSLRDAIAAAIPALKTRPSDLRMWVERGTVRSRQTANKGFAFAYQLNVLLTEFSEDIAVTALAMFEWARVNQPDLLAPGIDGLPFEADFLDNGTADILFKLDLTESVAATPTESGIAMAYLPEPDPLFADEQLFAPTLTAVGLEGEGLFGADGLPVS